MKVVEAMTLIESGPPVGNPDVENPYSLRSLGRVYHGHFEALFPSTGLTMLALRTSREFRPGTKGSRRPER
ncbi:MAG TPA: hypothetical protein VIS96_01585 [Terrimicrobiaceae bacterium]